ncbi:MAG: choice-of-anchor D domain-containing protein, partial [Thermoanaerobaculia bacterium]|nr:choice-of-anchor D domain-containing protein [Thermoanaerobaculia bacterium]
GGAAAWLALRPQPPLPLFSPDPLEAGQVLVGEEGEPWRVTVTNGGELPMRVVGAALAGPEAADFALVEDGCSGVERAPGESCEVAVRFAPTAVGLRRGTLELDGNLRWRAPTLSLVGTGIAPRAALDPPAVGFQEQAVEETSASTLVRIVNDGSAPLAITAITVAGAHAADFPLEERCAGRTFGPDERCAVRVAFRPRAAGPRRAELRVESDAPGEPSAAALTGTGLWSGPPFTAEPARLEFGSQRTGRASQPRTLRLVNRTAAPRSPPELVPPRPDSGFSLAGGGCGGAPVPPGGDCQVELVFRPEREGRSEATLTLAEAGQTAVNVPLEGAGVAPRLAIDRERLDFGDLRVGFESASERVTLRNAGTDSLAIRSARLAGSAPPFAVKEDRCSGQRLAPGERCAVSLVFRPAGEGPGSGRLEVRSDADPEPLVVVLAGRGTVSGFAARPSVLTFDRVTRGETAEERLEIANTGSARLRVRGVRTEGAAGGDYRLTELGCRLDEGLAPGASCLLTVEFRPSADGPRTAVLVIDHDGPDSPRRVELDGAGAPPLPGFRVTPESIGFGAWPVGDRSTIQTVTIENPGRGDLVIRDVTLAGAQADDFRIVPGTCQGAPRIVSGSSCTVGVGFRPQADGSRGADLVVLHNAGRGRDRVQLRGQGIR